MKKVIFSWLYILGFLLFEIAVFILFFPFNTDNDNYIASMIFWLVLTIIVSILSNNFYFCTVLTRETITFQHKYTGKKQHIQVGYINRFVIDVATIDNPTQSWLIVYANQQKGQILGIGNDVIMSLLKMYPHIPVVIKHFNIQLFRGTAKYLVKHKKVTRHKCEELCKFYHLSPKLLEQTDDESN
ncbi:MAG: hypothetical protein IJF66_03230 [Clostridia bacterium]|nr:hypothetical protein [Clostridia bacterium]